MKNLTRQEFEELFDKIADEVSKDITAHFFEALDKSETKNDPVKADIIAISIAQTNTLIAVRHILEELIEFSDE